VRCGRSRLFRLSPKSSPSRVISPHTSVTSFAIAEAAVHERTTPPPGKRTSCFPLEGSSPEHEVEARRGYALMGNDEGYVAILGSRPANSLAN
jgi:hypothetical protein